MNELFRFIKDMGASRIAAIIALAAIITGISAILISWLGHEEMMPLYTDLPFEDSGKIIERLENTNVPYQLAAQGRTILIPAGQILRLRMKLAENNLPSGGSIGYEIFDKSSAFGATSFIQNINHIRALEGELARSIKTINSVRNARVHLVIPKKRLFERTTNRPSASIVVQLLATLNTGQIRAIQHLTAAAVVGLQPSAVVLIDENGNLLAAGYDGDEEGLILANLQENTQKLERQKSLEIIQLVEKIVGKGKVSAVVAIELENNEIAENQDTFDPNGRVTRSVQTIDDQSSSKGGQNKGVSVGNELPAANAKANAASAQTSEQASRSEEITNYDISKKTVIRKQSPGGIKRLSAAVLVDGRYEKSGDDLSYVPRTKQEIEQIEALVRSAIGFDEQRGDNLKVVNLPFALPHKPLAFPQDQPLFNFTKQDYFHFAEIGVALVIGLLILLFAIRPLVRRITFQAEQISGQAADVEQLTEQTATSGEDGVEKPQDITESLIRWAEDSSKNQGRSMSRISELIEQNPLEATNIVKEWLSEAA